jgi:hypothetical protein
MALSGSRGSRLLLLALLVVSSVLSGALAPVRAQHGDWHIHTHAEDTSPCCGEAWAHTATGVYWNNSAQLLIADIKKAGYWYYGTCYSSNFQCKHAFSPRKAFSFPVTVRTHHKGDAGAHKFDDLYKDTYIA